MMKKEFAPIAEKNLAQINTPQKDSVQQSAGLHFVGIKEIRPAGKQPVYNMEVKQYHNFSVNGGIIVHNCCDSIRYFVKTRNLVPKDKKDTYKPIWM